MSLTGKNAKSIRKQEYKESRDLAQGFTKLVFAHKASVNESGINLGSLTIPTEMSALGFVNPSPSRLVESKLFQFKSNLTLISSLRGVLVQNLSYRVNSNSSIVFEGFTAEDGEIFTGIIDAHPVSGIQVIDAKQSVVHGDLSDGGTDFAIGFSTKTSSDDILVFRNGIEQKRNTNNSSTVEDGNYYVVDSGSGYGNTIRFNIPTSGEDDYIKVTAIGGTVESPTNSTWDELEKVQGQIDSMVPTLAAVAGVPETTFQSVPNNVDLRQFGAVLNGLLDALATQEQNEFAAQITSAASISFDNGNFIQSVSKGGTGIYTITWTPSFFTAEPSIVATPRDTTGSRFCIIEGINTSSATVRVFNETGTLTDEGFNIHVSRLEGDYRQAKTLREHLEDKGIL